MIPANANMSNLVTVKLSGQGNYHIWKAQMMCVLDSMKLLDMIDSLPLSKNRFEEYDSFVKCLILSSVDERILGKFLQLGSAYKVWSKLESIFEIKEKKQDATSTGFMFRPDYVTIPVITNYDNIELKEKLYEATIEACWWKAKNLMKNNKDAVTLEISENGSTMLHIAVEMGHNYFLKKLLCFLEKEQKTEKKDINGRTPLHIAAMIGNEYAAELLVQKNNRLLDILDYTAHSPLDIACTYKNMNIYVYLLRSRGPSGTHGYGTSYPQDMFNMVVSTILKKQYRLAAIFLKDNPFFAIKNDQILMAITETFPTNTGVVGSFFYPSLRNVSERIVMRGSWLIHYNVLYKFVDDVLQIVETCRDIYCSWLGKYSVIFLFPVAILYTIYELICLLILVLHFPFSILYFLIWKVLAIIVHPMKKVEKTKKEYTEAKEILSLVCAQMGRSVSSYKQAILKAVCKDAYLVVDEILYWSPAAINCEDEEGHNVIQLAIKKRSEKVYNLISHIIERMESYRTMEDSSGNSLLHLAVRLAPSSVLGRTSGATLQLQRELQWRKELETYMSPSERLKKNMFEETPAMLFNREHEELIKQGENWMKTTAESSSITAALIVTVVFAAAITVPGGNDQEIGIPLFRKEIAFTIFAVSNAFSLLTAATSLILFLSILTKRSSQRRFLFIIPTILIFGLLTLFLAASSMIVTFGSILFLVFCDQRPWLVVPLAGMVCLPITVIVSVKLPLLMDLFNTTFSPPFGKKSYLDGCKTNRKKTIFLR